MCLKHFTEKGTEDKWRRLTQLVVEELPAVCLQVKHTMPSKQRFLEYWESWGLAEQLGSLGHPSVCMRKINYCTREPSKGEAAQ